MKNQRDLLKIEGYARVVNAWQYLPWHQRKLLRLRFQAEVIRSGVNVQRLLFRAMFMGVLGTVTVTSALVATIASSTLIVPVLMSYVLMFAFMFSIKPNRIQQHNR